MAEKHKNIFDLNQNPFQDFDSAASIRDLLHQETGRFYQVQHYNDGFKDGFVVVRAETNDTEGEQRKSLNDQSNFANEIVEENNVQSVDEGGTVYHPALRTYVLYLPILCAGGFLFLFPKALWGSVFSSSLLREMPNWLNAADLIHWTRWGGLFIVGYHLLKIGYNYFSVSLITDQHGVLLKRGLIAQDMINVRYSEIRTIGLKQSVIDRLFNVGMLEFASSGSDGVDIRFYDCARPKAVKQAIEQRMEALVQTGR